MRKDSKDIFKNGKRSILIFLKKRVQIEKELGIHIEDSGKQEVT
jgi:hypothetical protein